MENCPNDHDTGVRGLWTNTPWYVAFDSLYMDDGGHFKDATVLQVHG